MLLKSEEEKKQLFINSLDAIWSKLSYDGFPVQSHSVYPYTQTKEYDEKKDLLREGPKRQSVLNDRHGCLMSPPREKAEIFHSNFQLFIP